MSTYFVNSIEWRNTYYAEFTNFAIGFGRSGAIVIDVHDIEQLAREGRLFKTDVILTLVNPEGSIFLERVDPENRWLVTVDESGATWKPYQRQINRCKKWDMRGVVVSYDNASHLAMLDAAGLKHVTMPPCIERIRPRVTKRKQVIISGRIDGAETKERQRLFEAFRDAGDDLYFHLPHPGGDRHTAQHQHIGEAYLQALDQYELGTIDCYGVRDRMVAKYVEFAACHVLPIGTAPSYMPKLMREAMVETSSLKGSAVVAETLRLLNAADELFQRQEQYATVALEHYQLDQNAKRVIDHVSSVGKLPVTSL